MKKLVQLKNKEQESLDPINLNYEKRISALENRKNIITAGFTENYVIKADDTSEIIPLNTSNVLGDKLSISSDGGILIGPGINKIKINCNINFQTITAGLKYVALIKNDTTIINNVSYISERTTLSLSPFLVEVENGDKIYLAVSGKVGDTLRRNLPYGNITIEVIG